jgi:hypothetical protein
MITRRLSRGVVADCFDKSEAESTYAIKSRDWEIVDSHLRAATSIIV